MLVQMLTAGLNYPADKSDIMCLIPTWHPVSSAGEKLQDSVSVSPPLSLPSWSGVCAPCCFKQWVLPSDRRRVSPTAGAQSYQMQVRGKRLSSSIETNQLLCAALVTLPAPALPMVSPLFHNFTFIHVFHCVVLWFFDLISCVASFQEHIFGNRWNQSKCFFPSSHRF